MASSRVGAWCRATACRVYLQRLPNTILITVEDNGVGFDAAEAERAGGQRGLGLIGIRERASHLRGTVSLDNSCGLNRR